MDISGLNQAQFQKPGMDALEGMDAGRSDASAMPGAPADLNDVERMQALMQPPPVAAAGNPAPDPIRNAAGAGAPSLGDRILQGMSSAGEAIQAGRNEAMEVLGKKDVTQTELLKANFAMLESSTSATLVSKTTEKLTQGVKTLQQG